MHGLSPLILVGDVEVSALETRAQVGVDGEALLLSEVRLHHRTEESEGHAITSCDRRALGRDIELGRVDAEGINSKIGDGYIATDPFLRRSHEVGRQGTYSDTLLGEVVAERIVLAHGEAEGRLR